jgi:hypothetical protein
LINMLPPMQVLKSTLESSQDCWYKITSFISISLVHHFLSFYRHNKISWNYSTYSRYKFGCVIPLQTRMYLDHVCTSVKNFVQSLLTVGSLYNFDEGGFWSNSTSSVKASSFSFFMVWYFFKEVKFFSEPV